jgi:hypothetical protein
LTTNGLRSKGEPVCQDILHIQPAELARFIDKVLHFGAIAANMKPVMIAWSLFRVPAFSLPDSSALILVILISQALIDLLISRQLPP